MKFKKKRNLQVPAYSADKLAKMEVSGALLGKTLDYLAGLAVPGVSTLDLDVAAEKYIRDNGGIPSFKGYQGFPASVITSVNDVVVHGIPNAETILKTGDLMTIDCGTIVDGWHADAAVTVEIGTVKPEVHVLNMATKAALQAGIQAMQVGNRLSDISAAVEHSVVESARDSGIPLEIVSNFGGHGIGTQMHQDPWLANYGTAGKGPIIIEGSTLCIEPIVTLGSDDTVTLPDEWTVKTADAAWAAHWEHTLVATPTGAKILTPNKLANF